MVDPDAASRAGLVTMLCAGAPEIGSWQLKHAVELSCDDAQKVFPPRWFVEATAASSEKFAKSLLVHIEHIT